MSRLVLYKKQHLCFVISLLWRLWCPWLGAEAGIWQAALQKKPADSEKWCFGLSCHSWMKYVLPCRVANKPARAMCKVFFCPLQNWKDWNNSSGEDFDILVPACLGSPHTVNSFSSSSGMPLGWKIALTVNSAALLLQECAGTLLHIIEGKLHKPVQWQVYSVDNVSKKSYCVH